MNLNQKDKARSFARLHSKGNPLVIYNIWDAGGAQAVARSGASAIATGSWSVAAAHAFEDGETIPLDLVETIVQRVCMAVDVPVTVDFEGGYAEDPADVAANVERIINAGAVGINFEDGIVGGEGLHDVSIHCERIAGIREAAEQKGIELFINARTDLFLQAARSSQHADLISEAKSRADAYEEAGASGFFAPGLVREELIEELCRHSGLPVNIMMMDGAPALTRLAELGVLRVSYGPAPYAAYTHALEKQARRIYAT